MLSVCADMLQFRSRADCTLPVRAGGERRTAAGAAAAAAAVQPAAARPDPAAAEANVQPGQPVAARTG